MKTQSDKKDLQEAYKYIDRKHRHTWCDDEVKPVSSMVSDFITWALPWFVWSLMMIGVGYAWHWMAVRP